MTSAHEVLGVRPGASLSEVRRAYRRYAVRHHPDHGGDPARFVAGQEAYRRLAGASPEAVDGVADVVVKFHRRRRAAKMIRRAVTITTHRMMHRPVPPPRVR